MVFVFENIIKAWNEELFMKNQLNLLFTNISMSEIENIIHGVQLVEKCIDEIDT